MFGRFSHACRCDMLMYIALYRSICPIFRYTRYTYSFTSKHSRRTNKMYSKKNTKLCVSVVCRQSNVKCSHTAHIQRWWKVERLKSHGIHHPMVMTGARKRILRSPMARRFSSENILRASSSTQKYLLQKLRNATKCENKIYGIVDACLDGKWGLLCHRHDMVMKKPNHVNGFGAHSWRMTVI